jgi:acetylornithine deacetylase/succinyl-diaminopimelate desuccinylase-like protein
MALRLSAAALMLVWHASAAAPPPTRPAPDWRKVEPELIRHFTALLRIDTSNPPGNETLAAKAIQAVLERDGIPCRLFALRPERANLVARLRGNGSKKPILIMGHTDVVGVQRDKWTVDPFGGILKDGIIYGRGTVDDKVHVAAGMMVMLLLKRLHVPLDRDVIFLAEAGEEGTPGVGIDFMVSKYWSEIAAEFALAEGGSMVVRDGQVRLVTITTTEKVPRAVRLVARGTAGHGSRPTQDNPLLHLAAAVAKFSYWQPPMRLNDTTRAYFERLAGASPPQEAARYRAILDPARAPEIDRYFARYEPGHYSILRTSIVPTILRGGYRSNVIPSEAEAYLDVRALPDEDLGKLVQEIVERIEDPTVEVIPAATGRPVAAASRLDTDMFRALETVQKRMFPGAVTVPAMLTGATDMAQLRARAVEAYGFGPLVEHTEGSLGGAHSNDERISVEALNKMVQFLWFSVLEVAATW